MPADDPIRRNVVSAGQVRLGYALGGVGAVSLIVAVLLLGTARPQGAYTAVDTAQHEAALDRADAALRGFELRDDGSVRIDIDHAMRLVAERGVDLTIVAAGSTADGAASDGAASDGAPSDAELGVAAAADGAALYTQHCSACHTPTGVGIPGAFPPLADHVGELAAADRSYPAKVVLFGLSGTIMVHGTAYSGLMPAIGGSLQDAEVAAILDHIIDAWGDAAALGDARTPYAPAEIAEWRALGLSATDVHALRESLTLP